MGKSILTEPQALHTEVTKLPGLDGAKMSKSYGNSIPIFEEGRPLEKLVMGIKTDSKGVADAKDPDELLKREDGAEVFRKALAGATDLLDYRFARLRTRLAGSGREVLVTV